MRWQRWPKLIQIVILALMLAFVSVTVWGVMAWQQLDSVLLKGDSRLYTVVKGSKAKDVLDDLAAEPVSPFWSVIWLKLHPELSQIKAGSYKIEQGWNVKHALRLFVSGKEAVFSVTLIEGLRIDDWLQTLSKAPYLENPLTIDDVDSLRREFNIDQDNIEGWFLPETYSYTAGSTSRDILRRAHNEMNNFLDKNWKNRDPSLPYESPYQALIMASIIEKETAKADERPRIASVFINRLQKKMKLQTDPTVIYGVKDRYDGNIHRRDLEDENPYNTYIIEGLPPTPIAMPSKEAVKAALHPDKTKFLYFVAKGGGAHQFSTTLADHNSAVKRYVLER
jgi:UPF0755 protein